MKKNVTQDAAFMKEKTRIGNLAQDDAFTEIKAQILQSPDEQNEVRYKFTNDYMFRAVLQTCEEALCGLLSALLDIPESEIVSCTICNPIILGDAIDEKTCIMDVRLLLNGNRQINLEMQIGHIQNWTDRSLYYLCRMFTDLRQGDNYTQTKYSIHIGILSEAPIPEDAAFYNRYALLNLDSHYKFSDKLNICVLDLSRLDQVPEEERDTPLYRWARVFQASTWEELLDMAEESDAIKKAVVTLHQLTAEEKIKLQCEARERYWMDWQSSMQTSREEGIAQERINTERERLRADTEKERADTEKERADTEKERADALEAELERYRKLLNIE